MLLFLFRKHTVDFEFQALLKRHFTRVMYFDATVMDPVDLERVKVTDRLIVSHGHTKSCKLLSFNAFIVRRLPFINVHIIS
jgi:hypothetical protein